MIKCANRYINLSLQNFMTNWPYRVIEINKHIRHYYNISKRVPK